MIVVNGIAHALIEPGDRGLSYGDGVFRTMRMADTQNRNWQRQFVKLVSDCARIGIACPDATLFEQDIALLSANSDTDIVKLIVTRGVGQRGYLAPSVANPTRIVSAIPLPVYPEHCLQNGVAVRICQLRLARQPLLAGIKHLNRLENVLARNEWHDPDIMEGLMLDEAGFVIGGTMTNLLVLRGRVLYTPDLSFSGIAGVTRERILAFAQSLGLSIKIAQLSLSDLFEADEVMLCNSVIGVWQIRELRHKQWQKGQYAALFRSLLKTDDN